MSAFDRIREWRPRRPGADSGVPVGMVPAEKLAAHARRAAAAAPEPGKGRDSELIAQRDRLAERFTMMQADLGGVFYEMAVRDHVRMDVLTRKAAELQRVDAELAEVERLLRGYDGPPAGACPTCAAPHGAVAQFCSRCGASLKGTPTASAESPASGAASSNGSSGAAA